MVALDASWWRSSEAEGWSFSSCNHTSGRDDSRLREEADANRSVNGRLTHEARTDILQTFSIGRRGLLPITHTLAAQYNDLYLSVFQYQLGGNRTADDTTHLGTLSDVPSKTVGGWAAVVWLINDCCCSCTKSTDASSKIYFRFSVLVVPVGCYYSLIIIQEP